MHIATIHKFTFLLHKWIVWEEEDLSRLPDAHFITQDTTL